MNNKNELNIIYILRTIINFIAITIACIKASKVNHHIILPKELREILRGN